MNIRTIWRMLALGVCIAGTSGIATAKSDTKSNTHPTPALSKNAGKIQKTPIPLVSGFQTLLSTEYRKRQIERSGLRRPGKRQAATKLREKTCRIRVSGAWQTSKRVVFRYWPLAVLGLSEGIHTHPCSSRYAAGLQSRQQEDQRRVQKGDIHGARVSQRHVP